LDIPLISFTLHLIILYFVTLQVRPPSFSLLVHDIMIPYLAAAGVLYTRLCTHPSISRPEQALVPSVLLYFDWIGLH